MLVFRCFQTRTNFVVVLTVVLRVQNGSGSSSHLPEPEVCRLGHCEADSRMRLLAQPDLFTTNTPSILSCNIQRPLITQLDFLGNEVTKENVIVFYLTTELIRQTLAKWSTSFSTDMNIAVLYPRDAMHNRFRGPRPRKMHYIGQSAW